MADVRCHSAVDAQGTSALVLLQDGNILTSSGVSAGMDMTMFFIDKVAGSAVANQVAAYAEYDGQWTDPGADKWA